jgi:hypothetical protein
VLHNLVVHDGVKRSVWVREPASIALLHSLNLWVASKFWTRFAQHALGKVLADQRADLVNHFCHVVAGTTSSIQ